MGYIAKLWLKDHMGIRRQEGEPQIVSLEKLRNIAEIHKPLSMEVVGNDLIFNFGETRK